MPDPITRNIEGTSANSFEIGTDGPVLERIPGTVRLKLPSRVNGVAFLQEIDSDDEAELSEKMQAVIREEFVVEGCFLLEGSLFLED